MAPDAFRFPADVSRVLRIAAICLYGVFLASVAPLFLPPRLLDPSWQLLAINATVAAAPFPLLATCGWLLAGRPGQEATAQVLLSGRMRLAARLACLGFVLLIPLQASALWRVGLRAEVPANRLISTLSSVRSEIRTSASLAELNAALAKLPGRPQLPPAFDQPITAFQAATITRLNQDLATQKQQQRQRIRARQLGDGLTLLRSAILASLFAIFFAAAARMPLPQLNPFPLRLTLPFKGLRSALARWQRQAARSQRLRQHARRKRGPGPLRQLFAWVDQVRRRRPRRGGGRDAGSSRR